MFWNEWTETYVRCSLLNWAGRLAFLRLVESVLAVSSVFSSKLKWSVKNWWRSKRLNIETCLTKIITCAKCQSIYYRNEWRRQFEVKTHQRQVWKAGKKMWKRICRNKIPEWETNRNIWIERATLESAEKKRLEKDNLHTL